MPVVAPLIIGAATLGAGALSASAAKSAADKQAQSAQNALSFQQQIYNQNKDLFTNALPNFDPYLNAGRSAASTLAGIYGPGGVTPQGTAAFANSPDYQFALDQGNLGLTRYENATGMGLSGGALKDVAQFNQGLASQQFGNYFSRLMSLSQLGSGAASNLASSTAAFAGANNQSGQQIGNTMQGIGQAQASGIVGSANAITGGINNGISNSLLYNYINKMPTPGANPSSYASPSSFGLPGMPGFSFGG